MKKYILFGALSALLLVTSLGVTAQSKNSFAIGFSLNQYQNDFGSQLHIVSPHFFKESVALKIGGNIQFLQHTTTDLTATTWSPYAMLQAGVQSKSFEIVPDRVYVYSEGGLALVRPNSRFSDVSKKLGGYGLFGFDFKINQKIGYFAEFGAIGTGARADKVVHAPIYSNGFLSKVGVRLKL